MADLAQHDSAHQAPLSAYGLALQQFDWGHPNELQTQWLVSQGVSFNSLIQPWPIGAARVTFNDGHFDPDTKGVSALTFVCFDRGDPIDIVAWQPKTGETATYLGRAVFLGDEDDVYNPATWFDGSDLRVHATPLEWLQHDRQGVVILNERRAGTILRNAQGVLCADNALAARIYELTRSETKLKIFLEQEKRVA